MTYPRFLQKSLSHTLNNDLRAVGPARRICLDRILEVAFTQGFLVQLFSNPTSRSLTFVIFLWFPIQTKVCLLDNLIPNMLLSITFNFSIDLGMCIIRYLQEEYIDRKFFFWCIKFT